MFVSSMCTDDAAVKRTLPDALQFQRDSISAFPPVSGSSEKPDMKTLYNIGESI